MTFIRSTIFNICFFFTTIIACIICLPTLLMQRGASMRVVDGWIWFVHKLEKYILGLDFEVRGIENLPSDGSFIIAAKHQSTYETFKLHILFDDPAIIMKRELLKIPLWGRYLARIKPIAIDRSDRDSAMKSIERGAVEVKEQGRPIVIFPQGTRVSVGTTTQEKPYRFGVVRMQEATRLPIIPLALNTGYFSPKGKWNKRSGTVIFEFLPAIEAGKERSEIMARLENGVEEKSAELLEEATSQKAKKSFFGLIGLICLALCLVAYCVYWFYVKDAVRKEHSLFLVKSDQVEELAQYNADKIERNYKDANVSGFLGPITLRIGQESFSAPTFNLNINDIKAKSWPFPLMPIHIETGAISFQSFMHAAPIEMHSFQAKFTPRPQRLELDHALFRHDDFEIFASGFMTQKENGDINEVDIVITIKNGEKYLALLQKNGIINAQSALFIGAGLNGFKKDGLVTIPVTLKDKTLYAGPFMILKLP